MRRRSRACGSSPSARRWRSTSTAAGGSPRRCASGSACFVIFCATAGEYDVVHTASFPYFSLLAAGAVRRLGGYELVVDWHEVWSAEYWREYLGRAGWVGIAVQRRCARLRQRAFCFSQLHAARLREEGLRGDVTVLEGEYAGPLEPSPPREPEPLVVFAARMIPEKRAPAVVPAVALAAERVPGLRGVLFGDGPDRGAVLEAIARLPDPEIVSAPGLRRLRRGRRRARRARAACCFRRDARATAWSSSRRRPPAPRRSSCAGPDNAAVELVQAGVNGIVAASAEPAELAAAIVAVLEAGSAMRASTSAWFARER